MINRDDLWDMDRSIVHLLHRSSQSAETVFNRLTPEVTLTARQLAVLAAVAKTPDINQTLLVEHTGIDRSTMADVVARLVRQGWLERRRTRADARAYAIRLTPIADQLLRKAEVAMARAEAQIMASLSAPDRDQLIGLLRRLIAANHQPEPDSAET